MIQFTNTSSREVNLQPVLTPLDFSLSARIERLESRVNELYNALIQMQAQDGSKYRGMEKATSEDDRQKVVEDFQKLQHLPIKNIDREIAWAWFAGLPEYAKALEGRRNSITAPFKKSEHRPDCVVRWPKLRKISGTRLEDK